MKKSAVTECFLKYFEKNRIKSVWISEKTGIPERKLKNGYEEPLTADEFLRLCQFLQIEPEDILCAIRSKNE